MIKPGYRPSEPVKNEKMLTWKHLYSFKGYGAPREKRLQSTIHETTMRSTLAGDSPYYRGRVAPFNVKHALVDPAHTMVMPASHKTRRTMDFMDYSRKKQDWTSRERQHKTRETANFNGDTYLRLPESRDYFSD